MPIYSMKWTMTGVVKIEAESPEKAQEVFDECFLDDIVETHDDFDVEEPVVDQALEESHG